MENSHTRKKPGYDDDDEEITCSGGGGCACVEDGDDDVGDVRVVPPLVAEEVGAKRGEGVEGSGGGDVVSITMCCC